MDRRAGGSPWRGVALAAGNALARLGRTLQERAQNDGAIRTWLARQLLAVAPDAEFSIYRRNELPYDDGAWAVDMRSEYGISEEIKRTTPVFTEAEEKFGIEVVHGGGDHARYRNASMHARAEVPA